MSERGDLMRYVPIYCIRDGAILGKTIYGNSGEILLTNGTALRASYITRLITLGIQGAYITDPLSHDLEIASVLSDELRVKTVQGVKSAFLQSSMNSADNRKTERQAQLMHKSAEDIVDEILAQSNVIMNMVDIKVYDDYTFYHCLNVTVLSVLVGLSLDYSREKLVKIAYAALLHDIGKVFIPVDIINKPGKLTDEEYEIVKKHPVDGYLYLREKYGMTEISARGVYQHHERFDGGGYPKALAGGDISEFGRIIAVCDVYDALISTRSYRKGLFAVEAMEYVMGGSGRLFDPNIVQQFVRKVALFPVGTSVKLSNGVIALVLENFEGYAQRPKLRAFMQDDRPIEPFEMDLRSDFSLLDVTIINTVAL